MRLDRVKLIAEMARQDVLQKELSMRTGISRNTIGFIRRGSSCSAKTATAIAKALGLSVEELIED